MCQRGRLDQILQVRPTKHEDQYDIREAGSPTYRVKKFLR
jgi:hypothetical protein